MEGSLDEALQDRLICFSRASPRQQYNGLTSWGFILFVCLIVFLETSMDFWKVLAGSAVVVWLVWLVLLLSVVYCPASINEIAIDSRSLSAEEVQRQEQQKLEEMFRTQHAKIQHMLVLSWLQYVKYAFLLGRASFNCFYGVYNVSGWVRYHGSDFDDSVKGGRIQLFLEVNVYLFTGILACVGGVIVLLSDYRPRLAFLHDLFSVRGICRLTNVCANASTLSFLPIVSPNRFLHKPRGLSRVTHVLFTLFTGSIAITAIFVKVQQNAYIVEKPLSQWRQLEYVLFASFINNLAGLDKSKQNNIGTILNFKFHESYDQVCAWKNKLAEELLGHCDGAVRNCSRLEKAKRRFDVIVCLHTLDGDIVSGLLR